MPPHRKGGCAPLLWLSPITASAYEARAYYYYHYFYIFFLIYDLLTSEQILCAELSPSMTGCSAECLTWCLLTCFTWGKLREGCKLMGNKTNKQKKLVKAHSSMDLREGVCVCVRVEEFDLNRKSRCEKWWMLTRTKIDCVWWTAWSEAPGVTTLSDGSVGHLCLFYGCALPRTGIDALLPHRLTSPL